MKTVLFFLSLIMSTGVYQEQGSQKKLPVIIKGKIVAQPLNRPVHEAYIYVTIGEEEAITDNDGNFTIKTWQSLPLTCIVEHKDFNKKKISVNDSTTLLIVLQQK